MQKAKKLIPKHTGRLETISELRNLIKVIVEHLRKVKVDEEKES